MCHRRKPKQLIIGNSPSPPCRRDSNHRASEIPGAVQFVVRNGTHTTELTYEQLRMAFDRTATLADGARGFRNDRLQAIIDRRTWKPMVEGAVCVAHLIPIASMAGRKTVDIRALYNDYTRFKFPEWDGASRTLNLDGLVVHPGLRNESEGMLAFVQVFRNGTMEALRHGGMLIEKDMRCISSTVVTAFFREAFGRLISAAQSLGFTGPAIVGMALLNVGGYEFAFDDRESFSVRQVPTDRPHLVLPESWLDSLETVSDAEMIVRPMLDVFWQSFGLERCYEYNEQGVWSPRR
jgi:hypothetical protein